MNILNFLSQDPLFAGQNSDKNISKSSLQKLTTL